MKISTNSQKRTGFTLIEMVGVLAVIAVLAALLVPKIFTAINEARMNKAVAGVNTAKSGAMMYFGKYGRFGDKDGNAYSATALPALGWDYSVLLPLGYLEKDYTNANLIGTAGRMELVQPTTAAAPAGTGASYDLSGSGANEVTSGAVVVQLHFFDVPVDDARDLSLRIDGKPGAACNTATTQNVLSTDDAGKTEADFHGRVTYAAPASGNADVYVYLAHK
jgi:prepilin-type N-terminal cleavage/methylation domain-containing protein